MYVSSTAGQKIIEDNRDDVDDDIEISLLSFSEEDITSEMLQNILGKSLSEALNYIKENEQKFSELDSELLESVAFINNGLKSEVLVKT